MRVVGFRAPQVGLLTAAVVFTGSLSVLLAYSPPGLRAPAEVSRGTVAESGCSRGEVVADHSAPATATLAATPIFAGEAGALTGELRDTAGEAFDLATLRGTPAVLFFTSMDCPVTDDYQQRFADLSRACAAEFGDGAVRFFAMNQDVGPGRRHDAREVRVRVGWIDRPFPTLIDVDSAVAARLGVNVTPTVVVLDAAGTVRYRGPFDDSRDPAAVRRHFAADALRAALEADRAGDDETLVAYRSK